MFFKKQFICIDNRIFAKEKIPRSFWSFIPSWSAAKPFLLPQIINVSKFLIITIPFIVMVVSLLPLHVKFIGLEIISTGKFQPPINFKILFISSLLFLAALLIYTICCPSMIKKYKPQFKDLPDSMMSSELISNINDRFLGKISNKELNSNRDLNANPYERIIGEAIKFFDMSRAIPLNSPEFEKFTSKLSDREINFLVGSFKPRYKSANPRSTPTDNDVISAFMGGVIRVDSVDAISIFEKYYKYLDQTQPISRLIFCILLSLSIAMGAIAFITLIIRGLFAIFSI